VTCFGCRKSLGGRLAALGAWAAWRRCWVLLLAAGLGGTLWLPPAGAQEISFRWAFGAVQGSDQGRRLDPLATESTLTSGDRLKMMVELRQTCFVYVFYRGPAGDLHQLFPYEPNDKDYRVGLPYFIPQGNLWFELDEHTGRETFYLMGADRPLEELEALYRRYKATTAPDGAARLADAVIAEIERLKESHAPLTATAERPIILGGSIRGVGPGATEGATDITRLAEDITAQGFFLRTYRIEHR
jgi:hypothetical protein